MPEASPVPDGTGGGDEDAPSSSDGDVGGENGTLDSPVVREKVFRQSASAAYYSLRRAVKTIQMS